MYNQKGILFITIMQAGIDFWVWDVSDRASFSGERYGYSNGSASTYEEACKEALKAYNRYAGLPPPV